MARKHLLLAIRRLGRELRAGGRVGDRRAPRRRRVALEELVPGGRRDRNQRGATTHRQWQRRPLEQASAWSAQLTMKRCKVPHHAVHPRAGGDAEQVAAGRKRDVGVSHRATGEQRPTHAGGWDDAPLDLL